MIGLDPIMKNRDTPLALKRRLIHAMVFPVTMYGSETWTMKKIDQKRINSFEMWCWRRMLRIPWTAKETNQNVLLYAEPRAPLLSLILRQALSYFGHVMKVEGLEREIMLGKPEGGRRPGRQRMRWLDYICEETGCDLGQLREEVQDRSRWRGLINRVTRGRK